MTQSTQILIFLVTISLTIVTILIGWQIFQILLEFRKILVKLNKIVDTTVSFTDNIGKSFQNLNLFSTLIKTAANIVNLFKKKQEDKEENHD